MFIRKHQDIQTSENSLIFNIGGRIILDQFMLIISEVYYKDVVRIKAMPVIKSLSFLVHPNRINLLLESLLLLKTFLAIEITVLVKDEFHFSFETSLTDFMLL